MKYFWIDVKKLYRSRLVLLALIILLVIAVIDPITMQSHFAYQSTLILDEPFNALDEKSVLLLRKLLCQRRDEGKLIIVTSHHKDDIEAICDEVIIMQDGTLKKPNDEGKQ